ncbi:MAG TPA: hypothetical protein VD794_04455, partial [Flavisolibacter sp.]|nr:hypothetical protein [Flavisolibacter sp.]
QYLDTLGNWKNIPWYGSTASTSGGGAMNQRDTASNYCFDFGAGTTIPLPANSYGSTNMVSLHFKFNIVPPVSSTQCTPEYWKNWIISTKGNQTQTAANNGGPTAGVYTLDDHLPLTLWTNSSSEVKCTAISSFIITTCNQGVLILDD